VDGPDPSDRHAQLLWAPQVDNEGHWESWDEHLWVRDQNRCLALLLEMERTESVIVRDWEEYPMTTTQEPPK
jgi:hypothetical protein